MAFVTGVRRVSLWLSQDARFQAAYREARSVALGQATARLQAGAGEAVDALRALMALKERPDVRVRAALGVLAAAMKAEELDNLVARVEALEQRPNARPLLAGGWPVREDYAAPRPRCRRRSGRRP